MSPKKIAKLRDSLLAKEKWIEEEWKRMISQCPHMDIEIETQYPAHSRQYSLATCRDCYGRWMVESVPCSKKDALAVLESGDVVPWRRSNDDD